MTPEPNPEPIVNSAWFDVGVKEGGMIIVGYFNDIQHFRFIEAGNEYVDDFEFISSLPRIPDLTSVRAKMDRFLTAHQGKIHVCVATYLATCISFAGWDDNVWVAYVKDSPLKLREEAQAQLFNSLADDLIGKEFDKSFDPNTRVSRTNKLTSELIAQIAGYEDKSVSNAKLVNVLRTLIRQVGFRMTPSTLNGVDQILKPDKLSNDQKKTLDHAKTGRKSAEP